MKGLLWHVGYFRIFQNSVQVIQTKLALEAGGRYCIEFCMHILRNFFMTKAKR